MLTLLDLLTITRKPQMRDLEFSLLQEMYENCLMPYAYDFVLSNGERVKLYFDPERFAHLLGLEKVAKRVTPNVRIHNQHKGWSAWHRMKNGKLSLSGFARFAGSHYDGKTKGKVIYFYSLPQLLESGNAIIRYVPFPASRLNCELLIFDKYDGSWVHVGLEKESNGEGYFPRSFFVERITTAAPNSCYVVGQPNVYAINWMKKYNRYPQVVKRRKFLKKRNKRR